MIFDTYIFGRNDLLELVERELSLTFAHIVPEDGLKPLNILPGKSSVLSKIIKFYISQRKAHTVSHLAGDADDEGHELL